jgi:hypothetical protein
MKNKKENETREQPIEDVDALMSVDQLQECQNDEDDLLKFGTKEDAKLGSPNRDQTKDELFNSIEFDRKEFSFKFFIAVAILLTFIIKFDANFIRQNDSFDLLLKSAVASVLLELSAQIIGAFRILTPLWIIIIFNKYPLKVPSIYRFKFAFWGIETVHKLDYVSQIQRVKIPWYEIVSVDFKHGKYFDYLELKNAKDLPLGLLHLGMGRKSDILNSLNMHISQDHPLLKKIKSMLEIKG